MTEIISIDLGASKTSFALFNDEKISKEETIKTPKNPGAAEEQYLEVINNLKSNLTQALTVGAAGYWNQEQVLKQSLNLPLWIDYPLWQNITKKTKLQAHLASDVELACLGEAIYGKHSFKESMLYINLGTGLSAALYKDNQLFKTNYSPTLRLDYLTTADSLNETQQLTNIFNDNFNKDQESIDQAIKHFASLLINLSFTLSPELIVIGGGKSKFNWANFIQPAIDLAKPYLNKHLIYDLQIVMSSLDNSCVLGGLELVKQNSAKV